MARTTHAGGTALATSCGAAAGLHEGGCAVMKIESLVLVALFVLAPVAATSCSDSGEPENATQATDINGRTISELAINGESSLKVGDTAQLSATLRYADGTTRDVTQDPNVVWNTDNPGIATVTNTGLVTAAKIGAAKITASYRGIVASQTIAVTP
jgi:hypothetical protein